MLLLESIILCVLGLFAIIGPGVIYEIKERWKSGRSGEPSRAYKVYVRAVGSLLFVIGLTGVFALLFFSGKSEAVPGMEEINNSGIETTVEQGMK